MNQILAIDPEFEAKCPPLTEEEFQQLEENILEEGLILMPLIIWNNIIVDGHNRYKIAQQHPGIEFRTHEKLFDSRYEAIAWISRALSASWSCTTAFTAVASLDTRFSIRAPLRSTLLL